ncbi:MAG TPA: hypothetical protein VFE53_11705 [Mucilaginibacter sp.]|nr:hypothetical protein [Mucilaginibacter sp.]
MPVVVIIYLLLLLSVSIVGMVRYNTLTVYGKVLAWSVVMVFVCNISNKFFSALYHNNAPILHTESILEFIFYSAIYFCLFKNKVTKVAVVASIIAVTLFFCYNAIVLQPFGAVFPTNIYLATLSLFTIFSLLLFRQMLLYPLKINIVKQSVFWFNTAMLFYATTMFFNLGMTNYYSQHNWDNFIYYFWYFILCVFHIMIGIALLNDSQQVQLDS